MRQVDRIFNSMVGKGETAPYIDCDYIESDGRGQYINTGIVPNQDTDIEIDYFSILSLTNNVCAIFGAQTRWQIGCFRAQFYGGSFKGIFGNNISAIIDTGYNASSFGHYMTLVKQGRSFTVTDVDTGGIFSGTTQSAYSTSYNLALFACISESATGYDTGFARIGQVRIRQSGVLVRDYRPKIHQEDGVTGFYDVVNGTFNPSANGVNFLYGYLI